MEDQIKLGVQVDVHSTIIKYLTNDNIRYDVIDSNISEGVYFRWNGEYTVGDTSVRGTRVWFKTKTASSVDYNTDLYSYNNDTKERTQNMMKDMEDKECFFPDDYLNIRQDNLPFIIMDLQSPLACIDTGSVRKDTEFDDSLDWQGIEPLEESGRSNYLSRYHVPTKRTIFYVANDSKIRDYLGQYASPDVFNVLENFPNSEILFDNEESQFWIIHKKKEMINELRRIVDICKTYYVTWHWV